MLRPQDPLIVLTDRGLQGNQADPESKASASAMPAQAGVLIKHQQTARQASAFNTGAAVAVHEGEVLTVLTGRLQGPTHP